ncbi:MAG TPA: phosphatase PAP2 family protein [Longimicrobiales bacterium]
MSFPVGVKLLSGEPVNPADFNTKATFPVSAWRPDLFAKIALAEFGATDWQSIDNFDKPKPLDDPSMITEIELLLRQDWDQRPGMEGEILDQISRAPAYFAQLLMLNTTAHPNTIKVLEMAVQVGTMVAVFFKLKFNRARPQQLYRRLLPMIPSPWHPSFPSGHTLESHMIALALSRVVPEATRELLDLADRIGHNREIAGVHYRSDTVAGRQIAREAFKRLLTCPTFKQVLDEARKEHGPPVEKRARKKKQARRAARGSSGRRSAGTNGRMEADHG